MAAFVQRQYSFEERIEHNREILFENILKPDRFSDLLASVEDRWGRDVECPLANNNLREAAQKAAAIRWQASRIVARRDIEGARRLLGEGLEFEWLMTERYEAHLDHLKEARALLKVNNPYEASRIARRIYGLTAEAKKEFLAAKRAADEAEAKKRAEEKVLSKARKKAQNLANRVRLAEENRKRAHSAGTGRKGG